MANITVSYKGLTGKQGSITIDNAQTLDSLISSIASAESISQTNYYNISLMRDFAVNSITYSDSASTLSSLGIITGDSILCTPNQNGSKQERQIQKLDISAAARSADGNARATYDITQLPTQYTGNDLTDNANSGGLVDGRPWTSVATLRSYLSGAGQTAYDAAATDSFFAVSSTDFDAVLSGLSGTSKLGMSDAEFAESNPGNPFSNGYIITMPQALATLPANNYLIGFRAYTGYSNQTWRVYSGPTYKSTSPVYSQLSTTTPSTGSGAGGQGNFYYLRKAPTVSASASYLGFYSPTNNLSMGVTTFTGSAYTSGAFTSWTNWGSRMPRMQFLITSTAVV